MINKLNAFKYFETILNLERKVAGARFIEFKEDYDNLDALEQKGTMCFLGRKGLEGKQEATRATLGISGSAGERDPLAFFQSFSQNSRRWSRCREVPGLPGSTHL